jgi:hypothetical protein
MLAWRLLKLLALPGVLGLELSYHVGAFVPKPYFTWYSVSGTITLRLRTLAAAIRQWYFVTLWLVNN